MTDLSKSGWVDKTLLCELLAHPDYYISMDSMA